MTESTPLSLSNRHISRTCVEVPLFVIGGELLFMRICAEQGGFATFLLTAQPPLLKRRGMRITNTFSVITETQFFKLTLMGLRPGLMSNAASRLIPPEL